MKLPFVSSHSSLSEPKSVLDIRQSPPSPVTANFSDLFLSNFEHGMINNNNNNNNNNNSNSNSNSNSNNNNNQVIEEWDSDSLMRELGLFDDSKQTVYPLELPELPFSFHSDFDILSHSLNQNINQNLFDLMNVNHHKVEDEECNVVDFRTELTRLAECFETQSFHLAQVILTRLNQRLRSPNGKPLQRAAYYFKEAIQNLFNGGSRSFRTSYEIVQVIKAYRMFSTVSPISMFSSFTANQAVLDAMDGAMVVHVIDFDIGLGGQWSSFLKAVAEKAEVQKLHSSAVRITAVVPEEYELESRLIRDNLHQFSSDLKLRFDISFVSIRAFEFASFKSIKFVNGEKTAVILSPMIFRRIGSGFVNDLRQIVPTVVVYVDGEMNGCGTTSLFSKTVIDGLEMYTTVLESLEAANIVGGVGGDWIRSIEMFVLLPKIIAMVEDGGRSVSAWREAFGMAGLRPVPMSQFAEFQAECLVRRVQVRGFHVVKQHAEMMLCWHDRPLVATSVWSF